MNLQQKVYCEKVTGWLTADEWVNNRVSRQKTEEEEPMYHQTRFSLTYPPPDPPTVGLLAQTVNLDANWIGMPVSIFPDCQSTEMCITYEAPLPSLAALNLEKTALQYEVHDLQTRVAVAAEVRELRSIKANLTETLRTLTQPSFNVTVVKRW